MGKGFPFLVLSKLCWVCCWRFRCCSLCLKLKPASLGLRRGAAKEGVLHEEGLHLFNLGFRIGQALRKTHAEKHGSQRTTIGHPIRDTDDNATHLTHKFYRYIL